MCNKMIKTNIGSMPLEDYLDIVALQNGFDDYDDLLSAGYEVKIDESAFE